MKELIKNNCENANSYTQVHGTLWIQHTCRKKEEDDG
jgi:hypothetical protein